MKLHHKTVTRLLKIYDNFGGFRDEIKLRAALETLDLAVYQQQSAGLNEVLVCSDELNEAIRNA